MQIKDLYKLFLKSKGVSTDTRNINKNSLFFALKGENFNANEFALDALNNGASFAIIDQKEYLTGNKMILVDNVLEILQDLATYHRNKLNIPIIALTGSNGKTTTKELINAVLKQKFITTATMGNLNNHIGVPLTLLSMDNKTEIGIVEFGANHPNEIGFLCNIAQPDYGYITNFGKAHLEGFGSLKGVIKAKTELYNYLKTNKKIAFVNKNDKIQVDKSKDIKSVGFGNENSQFNIEFIHANPFVKIKIANQFIKSKLIGNYNYNNIAAAITIGLYFNVKIQEIKTAIKNYVPTNNRSQIITLKTNKIILDAYNANPSSMESAILNFVLLKDKNKIAILGDMFELGKHTKSEHQEIVNLLEKSSINTVYLLEENFYNTESESNKILKFKNFNDFKLEFKSIKETILLIKASRGMALERVLDLI
jgi:UDP-N-acetylmuramoyl-tripeptide--D-alanyl-D-alanine ligase